MILRTPFNSPATTQRFRGRGFTLMELGIVMGIIAVLGAVMMSLMWNTEGGDAAVVASVQGQLESGAKQAAMQQGNAPNTTANLVTVATDISTQLSSLSGMTLSCAAGGGVCNLAFKDKTAAYLVATNGTVTVVSLSGFNKYCAVDGAIKRCPPGIAPVGGGDDAGPPIPMESEE